MALCCYGECVAHVSAERIHFFRAADATESEYRGMSSALLAYLPQDAKSADCANASGVLPS
jgi:hypothetical protein